MTISNAQRRLKSLDVDYLRHLVSAMPIRNEEILRIPREASEPLFPSEVTVKLNTEFGANTTVDEVAKRLIKIKDGIVQLSDGRWTLGRRV